jgi:hypothetical protein
MVYGIHLLIQNRAMKPLAIALSGVEEDHGGEMVGLCSQSTI